MPKETGVTPGVGRTGGFNGIGPGLSPQETSQFIVQHKHSGQIGDGDKIPASNIDFSKALASGAGVIVYGVDANGTATGRTWKIFVVEATDGQGNIGGVVSCMRLT